MGLKINFPLSFKGIPTTEAYLYILRPTPNKENGCIQMEVRPYFSKATRDLDVSGNNYIEFGERAEIIDAMTVVDGEEVPGQKSVQLPGIKTFYIIPCDMNDVNERPINEIAYECLKKELSSQMNIPIENIEDIV